MDGGCAGVVDVEPLCADADGWLFGAATLEEGVAQNLGADFLRACRRVARHMMHVDSWAQWAPEVRDTLSRIPREIASEQATRIVIKHAQAMNLDAAGLLERQRRQRRRANAGGRRCVSMNTPDTN